MLCFCLKLIEKHPMKKKMTAKRLIYSPISRPTLYLPFLNLKALLFSGLRLFLFYIHNIGYPSFPLSVLLLDEDLDQGGDDDEHEVEVNVL